MTYPMARTFRCNVNYLVVVHTSARAGKGNGHENSSPTFSSPRRGSCRDASRVAHREAQAYPSRPITMIVPFAAGGSADTIGRVMAERMRGSLGQPIIIENVSGADGSIGAGRAARARPDGYTIELRLSRRRMC